MSQNISYPARLSTKETVTSLIHGDLPIFLLLEFPVESYPWTLFLYVRISRGKSILEFLSFLKGTARNTANTVFQKLVHLLLSLHQSALAVRRCISTPIPRMSTRLFITFTSLISISVRNLLGFL